MTPDNHFDDQFESYILFVVALFKILQYTDERQLELIIISL